MAGGDGYPTLWMSFVPLNCAFKTSPNGNLYVTYTLPRFFKKTGESRDWRLAGMASQEVGPGCGEGWGGTG